MSGSAARPQDAGFVAALFLQTTWKLLTFNFRCVLFNIQLNPWADAGDKRLVCPLHSSVTSVCILVLLMASLLVRYCIIPRHDRTRHVNFPSKVQLRDLTSSP